MPGSARIPANKYATLFYAVYSNRLRTLTYVNAGHNPPLLLRATGTVERLSVGGPVLGMFRDASYTAGAATMTTGNGW